MFDYYIVVILLLIQNSIIEWNFLCMYGCWYESFFSCMFNDEVACLHVEKYDSGDGHFLMHVVRWYDMLACWEK